MVLVRHIAESVKQQHGRAFLVGGYVRDKLMGKTSKDLDVEVHGLDLKTLEKIITNVQRTTYNVQRRATSYEMRATSLVGKSFGVFKLGEVDVALARRDSKTAPGQGRKPQVAHDVNLTIEQASRRRDLTINALYLDPLTHEVLDPQGGLKDLKSKILRHVDAKRFGDDPLRVLRLMQFAGRFGFKIHPDTVKLSRKINLKHLSKERVGEEWNKLLLKSPKPSIGLKAAKDLNIFKQLHPALDQLSPADWRSSLLAADRITNIEYRISRHSIFSAADIRHSKFLVYAGLCYWFKSDTKIKKFLEQVDYPKSERQAILDLIASVRRLDKHFSDYELRKTAYDLKKHELFLSDTVLLAQALGLTALAKKTNHRASQLKILKSWPIPLIQGRDLIKLGLKPGPHFAYLLKRAMEAQWRGELKNKREALKLVMPN
jgi:tRNA nucleotidyltransferase (CCA-adding enzyme)